MLRQQLAPQSEVSKALAPLAELEMTNTAINQAILVNYELRNLYNSLLSAGQELISEAGSLAFEQLTPFSSEELNLLNTHANKFSDDDCCMSVAGQFAPNLRAQCSRAEKQELFVKIIGVVDCVIHELNASLGAPNQFQMQQIVSQKHAVYHFLTLERAINEHTKMKLQIASKLRLDKAKQDSEFEIGRLFEVFIKEKMIGVRSATVEGYREKFKLFFSVVDKKFDIRCFDKAQMNLVKQALIHKKSGRAKVTSSASLSEKTLKSYLSNYRTFFSWAVNHVDGIETNHFANIKLESNAISLKRRSFNDDEVRRQLAYKFQMKREAYSMRDDARWCLKISLYSGMRLNEICSLPLSAVRIIENVYCFDLRALKVKNEDSSRVVPIAQYLLDEGLIQHVDRLRKQKKTYLFSQLRKGKRKEPKNGWGDGISKWFSRNVLKNIDIDVEAEKKLGNAVVFHCNRRTMITKCVNNGAHAHLIKRVVGHSLEDDVTLTVYSDVQAIPLRLLKQMLDDNLDWHLED